MEIYRLLFYLKSSARQGSSGTVKDLSWQLTARDTSNSVFTNWSSAVNVRQMYEDERAQRTPSYVDFVMIYLDIQLQYIR